MHKFIFPAAVFLFSLLLVQGASAQEAVFFPIVVKKSVPLESRLPDTGIYFCQNGTDRIECPRSDEAFYGQDAHYNPPGREHRFTDNEDGTVTDEVTGLMWMQDHNDQKYLWQDAINHCAASTHAEYTDWRLPDYHELSFLTDRSRYGSEMTIDPIFSGQDSGYWTSSPYAGHSDYAWYVYFRYGYALSSFKGNTSYVRCVRSGP